MKKLLLLIISTLLFASCKKPEACFEKDKEVYLTNTLVTFNDCGSEYKDIVWDYGDELGTDERGKHIYKNEGRYTVTATLTKNKRTEKYISIVEVGHYVLDSLYYNLYYGPDGNNFSIRTQFYKKPNYGYGGDTYNHYESTSENWRYSIDKPVIFIDGDNSVEYTAWNYNSSEYYTGGFPSYYMEKRISEQSLSSRTEKVDLDICQLWLKFERF